MLEGLDDFSAFGADTFIKFFLRDTKKNNNDNNKKSEEDKRSSCQQGPWHHHETPVVANGVGGTVGSFVGFGMRGASLPLRCITAATGALAGFYLVKHMRT